MMKWSWMLGAGVLVGAALAIVAASPEHSNPGASRQAAKHRLERLIEEAATFFDQNVKHQRASESKAISDLLMVARTNDTSLVRDAVRAALQRANPGKANGWDSMDGGPLQESVARLDDLTFKWDIDDPEWMFMSHGVTVLDGRLHLNRPNDIAEGLQPYMARGGSRRPKLPNQYYGDDFDALRSPGSHMKRRDLRPFIGQIMTPAQYRADTRTHGELDVVPIHHPDPRLVAHLIEILERAMDEYAGAKGDNRVMVSDLLSVALTQDSYAVHDAVATFAIKHNNPATYSSQGKVASVIDPLRELLWGPSKIGPQYDAKWNAFAVDNSVLVLTSKFIFLGEDDLQWADAFNVDAAYWYRRDLSAFANQAP